MGSEFSWAIDAVVGVLVILSAYLAMVRGFFREILALLSWVVAFFAAFFFAPMLQPSIETLPVVGEYLQGDENCQVSMLASFVVVFGLALIVTGIVIWLFSSRPRDTVASVVDQGLGFIYGALRGLVLVAVIFIAYEQLLKDQETHPMVESAYTYDIVSRVAGIITSAVPDTMPAWLDSRVSQLMGECPDSATAPLPEPPQ